jgi:hypothetical protein
MVMCPKERQNHYLLYGKEPWIHWKGNFGIIEKKGCSLLEHP